MQLMTRKNGGETPLQEVADAWKREDHNFGWSEYESDAWAVEYAKKVQREFKEALLKKTPDEPIR
jgi:hypothetical protein